MGTLVDDVEITTDHYISEISQVEIKNSIIEALKLIPVNTGRSVEMYNPPTVKQYLPTENSRRISSKSFGAEKCIG